MPRTPPTPDSVVSPMPGAGGMHTIHLGRGPAAGGIHLTASLDGGVALREFALFAIGLWRCGFVSVVRRCCVHLWSSDAIPVKLYLFKVYTPHLT